MPKKTVSRRRGQSKTKDRVLQARIPEQLDDELRGRAEQLGLSVSTIVRNVLLNTFDLVEGVVTDSTEIARALTKPNAPNTNVPAETPPADSVATVIGWQKILLNRNGVCEECNTILPLGEDAAVGVPTGPRALLLCLTCLESRTENKTPATHSTD